MPNHKILLASCLLMFMSELSAQGYFNGEIELNSNFFIRDELIGAANLPHYDELKSGTDAWFSMNYINPDFDLEAGIRLDAFLNSIVHDPNKPITEIGIGRWYVRKKFNDLTITGGYFYDQFGSGMLFRAYEERPLGIDNSILGAHLKYNVKDRLTIKAFAGLQKNRFDLYKPLIKGLNLESSHKLGSKSNAIIGVSALNRTLDKQSRDLIVSTIQSQNDSAFLNNEPKFNLYGVGAYYTLNFDKFSWTVEGAYKTEEAVVNNQSLKRAPDGQVLLVNEGGEIVDDGNGGYTAENDFSFKRADGYVMYSNLTYTKKGLGATLQLKRTVDFSMRTSPNETQLNGLLNFVPPTARQNALRLPARYNAASQEFEENALSFDLNYSPKRGYYFHYSYSEIWDGDLSFLLFRESYLDFEWKKLKKFKLLAGFQYIRYNQLFYELKTDSEKDKTQVDAYSPFVEMTYKFDRKKSLRFEFQYQNVKNDFGQWLYSLIEFNVAPSWSVSVSDMWNFDYDKERFDEDIHYPSIYLSYVRKSHRFSLIYAKQVEGIVCAGGICRFEPAFSGVKFGLTSSF